MKLLTNLVDGIKDLCHFSITIRGEEKTMDIQVEKEKRIKRLLEELPAEQVDEVIDFLIVADHKARGEINFLFGGERPPNKKASVLSKHRFYPKRENTARHRSTQKTVCLSQSSQRRRRICLGRTGEIPRTTFGFRAPPIFLKILCPSAKLSH